MATISEDTARAFTDLVQLNHTSVKGYQEAAEGVQSAELKSQLSQFSQQRAQFVSQLEQQATQLGISASHDTTVEGVATEAVAAVHRGWINLKSAITGQNDSAILGECETGDATALKAYETALQAQDLSPAAKAILEQQHSQILSAKNWVTQHKAS